MVSKNKLNALIVEKGKRKKEVAENLGISVYSLRQKINGTREFKLSEISKLCDYLEISDPRKIFFARDVA